MVCAPFKIWPSAPRTLKTFLIQRSHVSGGSLMAIIHTVTGKKVEPKWSCFMVHSAAPSVALFSNPKTGLKRAKGLSGPTLKTAPGWSRFDSTFFLSGIHLKIYFLKCMAPGPRDTALQIFDVIP